MKDYPRFPAAGLEFALRKLLLYRDTEVDLGHAMRDQPEEETALRQMNTLTHRREAEVALLGAGFTGPTVLEMLTNAKKEADQILKSEA